MYIIFDTETTGLPKDYNAPINNIINWPRLVKISWGLYDEKLKLIELKDYIIKPEGYEIPFISTKIHGISTKDAIEKGYKINYVLKKFNKIINKYNFFIGHNVFFDIKIICAEFFRIKKKNFLYKKKIIDTKEKSINYCAIKIGKDKLKWPTLTELYKKLFNDTFIAHDSKSDVLATSKCFFELLRIGIISLNNINKKLLINKINLLKLNKINNLKLKINNFNIKNNNFNTKYFSHIHNHTSFSILSSTIDINSLIKKTIEYNMDAVGITDYGNMMGVFNFIKKIKNLNYNNKKIKPIIGCELFISYNYLIKKFTKKNPDKIYHQVFFAKNKNGYNNLSKLCSHGFIDGYYSGIPRIGKNLIEKYKENLIAISGDLNSEIPFTILNKGENEAEKVFKWWHNLFGDDFYIEILRHGLEEEDHVNKILLKFSKKYNVKFIAQNNNFYISKKDYNAHDILLCVKNSQKQSTPIGKGKGFRFGFPNKEFYFKNKFQMYNLFSDLPEAFSNLKELIEKVEFYDISNKILLPKFNIPNKWIKKNCKDYDKNNENEYLRFLTYKGAKKKYIDINDIIKKKIEFELETIKKIGYPGYFLIVQDFIFKAKNIGIEVGPGRGSVAGSVVAYCLGITNIDPIKYNLLFERFLNPDRVSLPDIDIDFDDKGREKIIEWVVNKYGKNKVAQIITYGKMGAKSSIRDTARVLNLPLLETNKIAKIVPNISLKDIIKKNIKSLKEILNNEELENVIKLKKIFKKKNTLQSKILKQAMVIEGSVRNTGIHACGIIITPSDIKDYIPVSTTKDSNFLLTQFDNEVVEKVGLLKMDFLGLKTLTIIKETLYLISNLKLENIPLDDVKTYELFQKGETVAVFQYESPGMQKYLIQLKPDKFYDLIAMNALYRPGPMQYIPNFIARKHGLEKISYDLPELKEFLEETYGITVYQEQVMLISQKISGFSKGDADFLRKAIGKKDKKILFKIKNKFIYGGLKNFFSIKILEKIWKDWKAFASYAFNKSHSTCYSYIAFQTAYLKKHYPAEYMASVLSNNMQKIKNVTFFIEECKRIGVIVLGPDINESNYKFTVNKMGYIRFGLGAIKGIGESSVNSLLKERKNRYNSILYLIKNVDLRLVNKKVLENLVLSGAFDNLNNIHRYQYFYEENGSNMIEKMIKFGVKYKKLKKNVKKTLFSSVKDIEILEPKFKICKEWNNFYKLNKEKEVIGMYMTYNPLNEYNYEIKNFTNASLYSLNKNIEKNIGKILNICGIISKSIHRISNNKKYLIFNLEDDKYNKEFKLFKKDYEKYKNYIYDNNLIYMSIYIKKYKRIYIKILKILNINKVIKLLSKSINIVIDINYLNDDLIKNLKKIIFNNLGSKIFYITVYDKKKNLYIKYISNNYFININHHLLETLSKVYKINFQLNT
ncbi:DNA polymerase III subunit alpha [Candidatus Karelsulcia muelleri]|uniref:DNA polymerase III subunit alpha n=1 Tax=Candidatus Karelsulcia muelleri PSPU TaxID=1189303 RepID=A0AAD1AYG8_9FLAO|nr:DNA polymerase III subunit alpha [Candidatus Karelsulcia muelleri]NJJ98632.1 DNA polymerase III subunit alpha [Candidatus Karelsulcia muelleri]BAO66290.1 DNA polymerase III subunit alpha [Candidatus Karelsulcia muelleri PSPU]